MKLPRFALTLALVLASGSAFSAITVPNADGTDGALNVTVDTTIDLSLAPTGTAGTASAQPGKGVYDATQWAVIFRYSSVNIAQSATLTFKNHPSHAPVIWLVNGAVTVAGNISLDGQNLQYSPLLAEAGPGGFRGGSASYLTSPAGSAGFGPGGGLQFSYYGGGASFGAAGSGPTGGTYGNPSLVPLIGGSGGAADPEFNSDRQGGGGGGGAILIASTGTVNLTGQIHANGGSGKAYGGEESGGGSGGAIRIVCDTLNGTGTVAASGGGGASPGGLGRTRVERVNNTNTISIVPDPSVLPLNASDTAVVFPPAGSPTVRVVSVNTVNAPADPRAAFGSAGADVVVPQADTAVVVIETVNVEQASTVSVRLTPRANANATTVNATFGSQVTANPLTLRWNASIPVNVGYSAVQVKVVRP